MKDNNYDTLTNFNQKANKTGNKLATDSQYVKLETNHHYFIRCAVLEVFGFLKVALVSILVIALCYVFILDALQRQETAYIVGGSVVALTSGSVAIISFFIKARRLADLHDVITRIEDLSVENSFHNLANKDR